MTTEEPKPQPGSRRRVTLSPIAAAAVAIGIAAAAFVVGLWLPRTVLPDSLALALPSSCESVIEETQRLFRATSNRMDVERLRDLAESRPDCFSDSTRNVLLRNR